MVYRWMIPFRSNFRILSITAATDRCTVRLILVADCLESSLRHLKILRSILSIPSLLFSMVMNSKRAWKTNFFHALSCTFFNFYSLYNKFFSSAIYFFKKHGKYGIYCWSSPFAIIPRSRILPGFLAYPHPILWHSLHNTP